MSGCQQEEINSPFQQRMIYRTADYICTVYLQATEHIKAPVAI